MLDSGFLLPSECAEMNDLADTHFAYAVRVLHIDARALMRLHKAHIGIRRLVAISHSSSSILFCPGLAS